MHPKQAQENIDSFGKADWISSLIIKPIEVRGRNLGSADLSVIN
jgi:hypothetical protein